MGINIKFVLRLGSYKKLFQENRTVIITYIISIALYQLIVDILIVTFKISFNFIVIANFKRYCLIHFTFILFKKITIMLLKINLFSYFCNTEIDLYIFYTI